jgi:hypothetical protein
MRRCTFSERKSKTCHPERVRANASASRRIYVFAGCPVPNPSAHRRSLPLAFRASRSSATRNSRRERDPEDATCRNSLPLSSRAESARMRRRSREIPRMQIVTVPLQGVSARQVCSRAQPLVIPSVAKTWIAFLKTNFKCGQSQIQGLPSSNTTTCATAAWSRLSPSGVLALMLTCSGLIPSRSATCFWIFFA